jgi:hypothetical protein
MYPYNSPGAFVPHSAINLSVKANEAAAAAAAAAAAGLAPSSLDLSMDATGNGSLVSLTSTTAPTGTSNVSSYLNSVSASTDYSKSLTTPVAAGQHSNTGHSSQILDLTRPIR